MALPHPPSADAVPAGALGVPLTQRLVRRGHQVIGLCRSQAGARRVQALNATPVVADVLDRDPLLRAVDGLLAAAESLGARRFLTQSVIFGYGYYDHGDHLLTEDDPFGRTAGNAGDAHIA